METHYIAVVTREHQRFDGPFYGPHGKVYATEQAKELNKRAGQVATVIAVRDSRTHT